ncbi:hypothetical protein J6590_061293 [Homalodisca vitripennis]|nr:hypothetical protein J6590_061293 [Homalodisca vitripennis]
MAPCRRKLSQRREVCKGLLRVDNASSRLLHVNSLSDEAIKSVLFHETLRCLKPSGFLFSKHLNLSNLFYFPVTGCAQPRKSSRPRRSPYKVLLKADLTGLRHLDDVGFRKSKDIEILKHK